MVNFIPALTDDYRQLIKNDKLDKKYRACLEELTNRIISSNKDNIDAIILYGGLVRDSGIFEGWSDIDVAIIFKSMFRRSSVDLAKIIHRIESEYSIRVDLTQVSQPELTDDYLIGHFSNSEVMNAISGRRNVSIVVFGKLPSTYFTPEQEKKAATFYIMNTMSLFRRYLIEVVYRGNIEDHFRADLQRITRWTFSIIRASLRLFDIYTHPYEYCLPHLKKFFPNLDVSLLEDLIDIRKGSVKISQDTEMITLIQRIDIFIEGYVPLCLRRSAHEADK